MIDKNIFDRILKMRDEFGTDYREIILDTYLNPFIISIEEKTRGDYDKNNFVKKQLIVTVLEEKKNG